MAQWWRSVSSPCLRRRDDGIVPLAVYDRSSFLLSVSLICSTKEFTCSELQRLRTTVAEDALLPCTSVCREAQQAKDALERAAEEKRRVKKAKKAGANGAAATATPPPAAATKTLKEGAAGMFAGEREQYRHGFMNPDTILTVWSASFSVFLSL